MESIDIDRREREIGGRERGEVFFLMGRGIDRFFIKDWK